MNNKFVSYRRVSTKQQGASGLGLEGQAEAVNRYVEGVGGELVGQYVEVESGANCDRPELARALAHANRSKATLVVAKLDRLSRNTAFLCTLLESGVDLVACDNPTVNRLTLQILAVLAENERRQIVERTRAALAAKKARGALLGSARPGHWEGREEARQAGQKKATAAAAIANRTLARAAYADIVPLVKKLREEGRSLWAIAKQLDAEGHTTRRGRPWNPMQVSALLKM